MNTEEARSDDATVDVERCARCGGSHKRLVFKRLTNVTDDWSHWALCPELREPIMLRFGGFEFGEQPPPVAPSGFGSVVLAGEGGM